MLTWNLMREEPDAWRRRLPSVVAFLAREAPDILCLQEALPFQLADLRRTLPGLRWVPGATDERGEHNAIAYDPRRWRLLDSGSVPLARPRATRKRVASWARFVGASGTLTVVNTHFDHQSARARVMAADLLRRRFPDAIFAGDFNAEPGSEPHAILTRDHHDTLPMAGAETMAGADGHADARYDGILVPPQVEADEGDVLRDAPSDHYAVSVDVRPRRADE